MKCLCFLAILALAFAIEETPAFKAFKSGNLKFSANTYTELAKENVSKNFLVCPLSVSVVLALVEAGAGGKTAQQLLSGLNLPDTEEKIHEAFKSISPSLNVNEGYTLSSANKVYVKEGFKIKPHFKDIATSVFSSEVTEIDFVKDEAAAAEINKWVLEKTDNKINNLVSKDDLDEDTAVVLINALYFYGLWAHSFYAELTSEKPFKISKTSSTKVKLMEQTNKFNYYEDTVLKAKFLEMSYYRSPISITFVLPNDIDGLPALESNIEKVLETPNFTYESVHVQIPRVNIEHKINFIPILQKFGVEDAFEKYANFSRLNENEEHLFISKIIQKTFIAIEEKGTTAAAATAVIVAVGSSAPIGPPKPPKEFEANHPFLFKIESDAGILFVGRYVDPNN